MCRGIVSVTAILVALCVHLFPPSLIAQSESDPWGPKDPDFSLDSESSTPPADVKRLFEEARQLQQKARSKEDLQRALQKYEDALIIVRKSGDSKLEARTLNNLGWVHENLGENRKAVEYFGKALEIRRKIGDVKGEGETLASLGWAYQNLGENQKALEVLEKALGFNRKIGDVKGEGLTLNHMGWVYQNLGQYEKALEHLEKALEIRRSVGDIRGEGRTLNNIGIVCKESKQCNFSKSPGKTREQSVNVS